MNAVATHFTECLPSAYHRWRGTATSGTRMASGSLAETFMENRGAILRYLRARGAGDEAEDLLQELWMKLDGGGALIVDPIAYLYRMAHNLMLDRARAAIRRRGREQAWSAGDEADDAPAIERTLLARERLREIERVLAALGERTDYIFRRHRVDGVAQRDIALELGLSLSAIEKHLQKAYRATAEVQRRLAGDAALEPEASDGPR